MNEQKPPKAIEWTRVWGRRGFTWNPVGGCKHECRWQMPDGKVAICYAEDVAGGVASNSYPQGFNSHYFHPSRLDEPLKHKEPAGIFIASMADLMGHWVPDDQVQQVLDVCAKASQHIFFLLTKNAPRLLKFQFPANVWVGVSSPPDFFMGKQLDRHQQERMLRKSLEVLKDVKASVRWLSAEPLSWPIADIVRDYPGVLQWCVVGAASNGKKEFPPRESDLRDLLAVLDEQGVKTFYKGNLRSLPYAAQNWREEFPPEQKPEPLPPAPKKPESITLFQPFVIKPMNGDIRAHTDLLTKLSQGDTDALLELKRVRGYIHEGAILRAKSARKPAEVAAAELDQSIFDDAVARAMLNARVNWWKLLEENYSLERLWQRPDRATGTHYHVETVVKPYALHLWRIAQRLMMRPAEGAIA